MFHQVICLSHTPSRPVSKLGGKIRAVMEAYARFEPNNPAEWRAWLDKNHVSEQAVWLIMRKKSHAQPNITWSQAVDEALCYGWIDGKARRIDEERYEQYFVQRKAKSVWSLINKQKIETLTASGLMRCAGLAAIQRAKENGSWALHDSANALEIPADLEAAFAASAGSLARWEKLSQSVRRSLLQNIAVAKQAATRAKRIDAAIAACVAKPAAAAAAPKKTKGKRKREQEDEST